MDNLVPMAVACNAVLSPVDCGCVCITLIRHDEERKTQISKHGLYPDDPTGWAVARPFVGELNDLGRTRGFTQDDVEQVHRLVEDRVLPPLACPACNHDFDNPNKAPTVAALLIAYEGRATSGGRFRNVDGPCRVLCVNTPPGEPVYGTHEDPHGRRTRILVEPGLVIRERSALFLDALVTAYFRSPT